MSHELEGQGAGLTYPCKRCGSPRPAVVERGKDKIRSMRSGYVARFLECGHSCSVNQAPA